MPLLPPLAAKALQKLHAAAANRTDNENFSAALTAEAARRARRFIAGITAYQRHPAARHIPDAPVVWEEGTTRLLDYNPGRGDLPTVLVIPSLINRFDILDLERNQSFLRALAAAGFRPYAVDWGTPGEAERDFALDDYIKRLTRALDFITKGLGAGGWGLEKKTYSPTPNSQPLTAHVLGYCMGGMLALALAAEKPAQTASLSLFATPWDFHQPDEMQGKVFLNLAREFGPEIEDGGLAVEVIQYLFAALQPMQVLEKFSAFAAMDMEGDEARRFVLLEDWLQDGVPLASGVALECIKGWYGANHPAKFEWRVGATLVDPRLLAMPSYVVVPGRDRIVPPESALPLAKLLPHAALHEPMTGHIGLMASARAPQQVWAPYFHWLKKHA